MNKQDVIEFFDRCAATWDAGMIKNDKIIGDKIIYHPNGTIALISPHKDGKPNGVTKKFKLKKKLVKLIIIFCILKLMTDIIQLLVQIY